MAKSIKSLLLATALLPSMAWAAETPTGDILTYRSKTYYTWGLGYSWYYSETQAQEVCFQDGKLYIEGLCGGNWAEGTIIPGTNSATFETGQYIDEGTKIYALYKEGDNVIDISQFVFSFTDDKATVKLDDYEGHEVILYTKYDSGYDGIYWTNTVMNLCTERAPEPPADGESRYYSVSYVDTYGSPATKTSKCVISDNKVWLKDLAYKGKWIEGTIEPNGNWHFPMPQFQGVVMRYFSNVYGRWEGMDSDEIIIVKNSDDTYSFEEGYELWSGESGADYCVMKGATFTQTVVYEVAPKKPENVMWNGDYPGVLDFELPMVGVNDELLNNSWIYWQVLVNDTPYVFKFSDYMDFYFLEYGDVDKIHAWAQLYSSVGDESISWGKISDNQYRAILKNVGENDKVAVKCGYLVDDVMYWSDAVSVDGETEKTPLPDEALYTVTVSYETELGPYLVSGDAMNIDFTETGARIAGFFGGFEWVDATFGDEKQNTLVIPTRQSIGMVDDVEVTLVPATMEKTSASTQFKGVDSFTLKIKDSGNELTMVNDNIYLLAMNGNEILNVWCPDLTLNIVNDKVEEVPENLEKVTYQMTYYDSLAEEATAQVNIYTSDNEVWLKGLLGGEDVLKGEKVGDNIEISLPQFVGIMRGQVAYATDNAWSFKPSKIILTSTENGYTSNEYEIWIGKGLGYASWRQCTQMVLTLDDGNSVKTVEADSNVRFENGMFVSDSAAPIRVFTVAGIELRNQNLEAGTYIVISQGKTAKVMVK